MALYQVGHDGDDAYKRGTTYRQYSRDEVSLGKDGADEILTGFRFLNVAIPKGDIIDTAVLELRAYGDFAGAMTVVINGEKQADPARWSGSTDFAGRPLTTESKDQEYSAWNYSDWYSSVDLSEIIQEIIDQDGWVSGNALVIRIANKAGNTVYKSATSFYNGSANAAKLTITSHTPAPTPPVAEFSGTPLSGTKPLTVQFTDESTNTPTSWAWLFGDGGESAEQSPEHKYETAGSFTVKLTATNDDGSDDEEKPDYVTVSEPPAPPAAEINPDAFSGYHCFIEQYQKRRIAGKTPYKRPNGTLIS